MRYFLPLLLLLVFIAQPTSAQLVTGRIVDQAGKPVPYASAFVKTLHRGTTANDNGEFALPLPEGQHSIAFQYLGYKTLVHTVNLQKENIHLDVTVMPQEYMLPEVIVTAGDEDPAYYVMRKAIGMSQYYRNQVSAYTARIYLKGSGIANKIPFLIEKQFKKEGIEEGKSYVTETLSEISYTQGSPLQTKVISVRSSLPGSENSPMQFFALSLYNDVEGYITPLSKDAFAVYKFKLEGTYLEGDHTIYKIRVTPKRKGNDLYSGLIFIRDGSWSLYSVQLKVTQKLFNATIRQQYLPVMPMVWMPLSHDYLVDVDMMGVKFTYQYLVTMSDYKVTLNPKLDHEFYAGLDVQAAPTLTNNQDGKVQQTIQKTTALSAAEQQRIEALMTQNSLNNKEMRELNKLIRMEAVDKDKKPTLEIKSRSTQVDDSAALRTPQYWSQVRPVPLTVKESEGFAVVDSTEIGKDSLKNKKQSLPSWILFGGARRKIGSHIQVNFPGLLNPGILEFSTVEGFSYRQRIGFSFEKDEARAIQLDAKGAYAFSSKRLNGEISFKKLFAPMHRGEFTLSGGRITDDFNHSGGVAPFINTINSLFFKTNLRKLYEKDFLKAAFQIDPVNGFELKTGVEWAKRSKLYNTSHFFLTNPYACGFTSNIPDKILNDNSLADNANAVIFGLQLKFTPMQYYRIVKGRKMTAHSAFPTFGLDWTMTHADAKSATTNTQQLDFSARQSFDSRLWGRFEYLVKAGFFLGDDPVHFADYKHFNVISTHVGPYPRLDAFRGFGIYGRSTTKPYIETHLRYEHGRILVKRLPFLAGSLMRESLFVNHLAAGGQKPWLEIGYGVQQLFLLFNAEVFTGFEGGKYTNTGIRIAIPIGEGTIRL